MAVIRTLTTYLSGKLFIPFLNFTNSAACTRHDQVCIRQGWICMYCCRNLTQQTNEFPKQGLCSLSVAQRREGVELNK